MAEPAEKLSAEEMERADHENAMDWAQEMIRGGEVKRFRAQYVSHAYIAAEQRASVLAAQLAQVEAGLRAELAHHLAEANGQGNSTFSTAPYHERRARIINDALAQPEGERHGG